MSEYDPLGAFVSGPAVTAPGATDGPLAGKRFAAKDLFDVAGLVTGCGNPDWARTHPPAPAHAWAVQRLLDGGASLAGRTITDEISLGLLGRNMHFGTPLNPAAPDRMPGGSSSGSASAVAAGAVELALGSDTGGSVRVPASFTGLYGLRPTHGRIPVEGLMRQAASFDTVGFFTRDAETFAAVGRWLLQDETATRPRRLLVARDAFACADPEVAEALAPAVDGLRARFAETDEITLAEDGLDTWRLHQRRLQQHEYWNNFAEWIDRTNPRFSFEVARGLATGAAITEDEVAPSRFVRARVRERLEGLLRDDTVICLPTVPILPPMRDATVSTMAEAGRRILTLTCIAGLTGLPQASLPLAKATEGTPVGLSLMAWRNGDVALVDCARNWEIRL